jgi:hypothetical protein
MSKYKCGSTAAYRSPSGDLVFGKWHCGATLKCTTCGGRRARALINALQSVQPGDLKLCHLTVTFKPSLNVTIKNVAKRRHALIEWLRRRNALVAPDYVCVVERHKSGKPHLHIALWWRTVRDLQRAARDAVQGSHVRAKLIRDSNQLTYLAKYVGKQSSAKITSSRNVARLAQRRSEAGWELIAVKPENLTDEEFRRMLGDRWAE